MSCPYFRPETRLESISPGKRPLGDAYRGTCSAEPGKVPDGSILVDLCNMGYARGVCPAFPSCEGPDAVRFSIARDDTARVEVQCVLERDHGPYGYERLSYALETRKFDPAPSAEWIASQARAYIESYLRRKVALNAH
jgi:hypothetical protein